MTGPSGDRRSPLKISRRDSGATHLVRRLRSLHRPQTRALLSIDDAADTLRRELETTFACPVVDLYSLNEAGPIAAYDARAGGHVLLQHRMLVEIVDAAGRPVPRGARGEVTLTGGFNFCLPLLRYRTGDFASLEPCGAEPMLVGLEGRAPVRFRTLAGEWLNNIEVTHALQPLELRQFQLHQGASGELRLSVAGLSRPAELRAVLSAFSAPSSR